MKQVIRLSEHFRQYTSMEWSIDWKKLNIREKKDWFRSDRDYFWVLALGSFHPNGYYRQACLLPGQYQPAWRYVPWMNCLWP